MRIDPRGLIGFAAGLHSSVSGSLPQIGPSFRLVGAFEKAFGGMTTIAMTHVLGHVSHEQLAFLEIAADLFKRCERGGKKMQYTYITCGVRIPLSGINDATRDLHLCFDFAPEVCTSFQCYGKR